MSDCTGCGAKNVDNLVNIVSGTMAYNYMGDDNYEVQDNPFEEDGKKNDYCCPKCLCVIATNERDADAFLKE